MLSNITHTLPTITTTNDANLTYPNIRQGQYITLIAQIPSNSVLSTTV